MGQRAGRPLTVDMNATGVNNLTTIAMPMKDVANGYKPPEAELRTPLA